MRVPLSWLREYVDITITAEELAERLTLAGLEVAGIEYIGVPQGVAPAGITVPPSDHLVWARDKIVLGAIHEVKPHPNADKLVLAIVDYGAAEMEQVVTGAPNLYPYKGQGKLNPPLYAPLALEGAEVYDGHAEGQQRMILKEKALRGIPNRSMVCSAKELGLGEDHDGILLLEDVTAPPGTPFVDIMGDVILAIELTPNMARAYGILGVAREVAALTGQRLREPNYEYQGADFPVEETFTIEIHDAELNPRFCGMFIKNVEIKPSPMWLRRRLASVGVRSINNIVDVTNYVMFELGQPLHAFDYDVLLKRSGGKKPTIITRRAKDGEVLETLDGVQRPLDDQTIMVCDSEGILSLGGIMGGAESEIRDDTVNVLLEAANWNYINIRRTMTMQKMSSEAGLRFSRGVHPAQSMRAITRAAELMRSLSNEKTQIARGVVDIYPKPAPKIVLSLPLSEVTRLVGIELSVDQITGILTRLQFGVEFQGDVLRVSVPDHRVDISADPAIGIADLCEEIARIYGYDRIPDTLVEDALPPQHGDAALISEERVRDILAGAGLRETINYRLTTPEAEARLIASGMGSVGGFESAEYVTLANPISAERTVLRHTLLNGLLDVMAANQRHASRQKLFEIGSVFLLDPGALLPREPRRLAIAMCGMRDVYGWQDGQVDLKNAPKIDFFDLKGVIETLVAALRIRAKVAFKPAEHTTFFPGRCAALFLNDKRVGVLGEVHPLVCRTYELQGTIVAAELDLELLTSDLPIIDTIQPIITQPPVYEDIALVLSETVAAADVEAAIKAAGGEALKAVSLFDVYRGGQIPEGKKSLAYSLTYQAEDHTLNDKEVAGIRSRIVKALEQKFGATLRS
ncbi:MAG: phenylalanine--tRNA ligase subunit beta [Anaerolineae bacterium]